jgi:hypothetical protein
LPRLFVNKLTSDVRELSDPPGPLKKTWLGGQHRILVRTSLLATVVRSFHRPGSTSCVGDGTGRLSLLVSEF